MREIVDLAQKVARLPATVLIQGESGTGKELLARLLHRESGGSNAPFIAVNLAAVPKDLVESTLHGDSRFSAEVVFQPRDHMILDADSVNRLETQVASLVHTSMYSRALMEPDQAL